MSVGIKLKVGKVNVRSSAYPSEARYVKDINKGLKELEKNLISIVNQFQDVTPAITLDALVPIYELSQTYVPVRGGTLKDSGYMELVERRGNPVAEVGYAKGGNPDYAVYVHEMVEIPHTAPTRAKFLEHAVNEKTLDAIDRIVANYKEFMGE